MRLRTKTATYDISGNRVYIEGIDNELPSGVDAEKVKYTMMCESYVESNRRSELLPIMGKSNALRALDLVHKSEKQGVEELDLRLFDMNEVDMGKAQEKLAQTTESLINFTGCLLIIQLICGLVVAGCLAWFIFSIF